MARPEELTTPLYSLGAKLLVVCAGPRQPCLQSGNNFCAVDTYLYFCDSAGDKPWYLHRGKLPLRCISNLPLWVTNEGRETIKQISGAVAGDSILQDRGVAHYLLSLLFSLVSLSFSFCFCVLYPKYQKNSYLILWLVVVVIMSRSFTFGVTPEAE